MLKYLSPLSLDVEMSTKLKEYNQGKVVEGEDNDLTFFMAEYYHNILFKAFCSHMDMLLVQREFCKFTSNS